ISYDIPSIKGDNLYKLKPPKNNMKPSFLITTKTKMEHEKPNNHEKQMFQYVQVRCFRNLIAKKITHLIKILSFPKS
ncbi:hypothetical protein, partial [Streptococcus suis]|uniref:hypothetical protein n=1 Tax=Streptococcus suis TaxID=1307 RepID=UPI001EDD0A80